MRIIILTVNIIWILLVGISFSWNYAKAKEEQKNIALQTARSFFDMILMTREWNAQHGGVYVPVTDKTPPNPYLEHPQKIIKVNEQLTLTLMNPSYMTRQISEFIAGYKGVQFRITSLRPVRPENSPLPQEKRALMALENGANEVGEFAKKDKDRIFFYMAPLKVEESCLKCHAKHGYKKGDIRGAISLTLPFIPKIAVIPLLLGHIGIGVIGLLGIVFSSIKLGRNYEEIKRQKEEKEKMIQDLQDAFARVKQLSGMLPICSSCKKIRDDKGYWEEVSSYITKHSEVLFSHGLCPDCKKKAYEEMENLLKDRGK